jgi:transposase
MTVGLDLSDKFTSVCFLDGAGDVIEESRIRTSEAAFTLRFGSIESCRIILEVGTHSPWASRLLSSQGHEVVVANPGRVRLIADGVRKTDRSDAEMLARLGRIDPQLLSPVSHRNVQAQADLAVIRAREALVSARTSLINHVRGAVKSLGARLPASDAYTFHKKVAGLIPEELIPALTPVLELIASLSTQIAGADKRIETLIRERYPTACVLQQVPGVGPLISLSFILTISDPTRFRRSREVGPYLGLVPKRRESGDSAPELGITKVGDRYLRRLLVNGAHYIMGFRGVDSDLRRWGLQHAGSGGKNAKKRAVVAVARKLAVLLHHLWVTGEVYVPIRHQMEVAA